MKKLSRVSTALLAAVLLAGCGSISSKDGGYYATESPSAEGAYDTAAGAANSSIVPEELPDSTDETAQKIIYNADINMESTDFDAARDTLLAAVDDCGAWMEYSSLSGDAKDHDRYAYYTVRVPVENYRTFLAAVGEAGKKGRDIMVTTESVTIKVPVGMSKYLVTMNPETELTRNALLLYPYILNQTISHGRAAEILGIRKSELIDLYDKLGYSYFDMTMDDLDDELNTFRELKKKEAAV